MKTRINEDVCDCGELADLNDFMGWSDEDKETGAIDNETFNAIRDEVFGDDGAFRDCQDDLMCRDCYEELKSEILDFINGKWSDEEVARRNWKSSRFDDDEDEYFESKGHDMKTRRNIINENQKITLTLEQLKRLVRESDDTRFEVDVLDDVRILWQFYTTDKHLLAGWDLYNIVKKAFIDLYGSAEDALIPLSRFALWAENRVINNEYAYGIMRSTLYTIGYNSKNMDSFFRNICDYRDGEGIDLLLEYFIGLKDKLRSYVEKDLADAQAIDEFNEFYSSKINH